jgi:hypothetical protein
LIVAIVCDVTGGTPASTLTDLLGAAVAEVTAQDIAGLIDGQVRETDELDFKATLYGRDEDAKVELCKDIAGLCNHRGGAILLGVGEKNAVANGRPEVDLSDAEERRMRQIVATGTAPHAAFEIRAILARRPAGASTCSWSIGARSAHTLSSSVMACAIPDETAPLLGT